MALRTLSKYAYQIGTARPRGATRPQCAGPTWGDATAACLGRRVSSRASVHVGRPGRAVWHDGGMEAHEGGCLCGAIRYVCEGAPCKTSLCFCTQCQRQTGAAMPAFATFLVDRVRVVRGEPKSYRASPRAVRQFCGDCGSTLFWRADGSRDVDVFLGTLDDRGAVAPPAYALWTKHRVPWLGELPGVRSYVEGNPDAP